METRSINIEDKSRLVDKTDGWNLGSKALDYHAINNIFYVLVEISSDQRDRAINYYIISKNDLHQRAETEFVEWRSGTQKSGKARKSEIRFFRPSKHLEIQKYKDNWNILFQ